MYKNLINKHLNKISLTEEAEATGLKKTKTVQSQEKKFNDEYYKEVEDKMEDYDSELKQEDDDSIEPPKTNAEGEQKVYHDEMEIRNGQEMLKYDNYAGEFPKGFKERAEMALKGHSKMGNKTYEGKWNPETGEGNGNTEEVWGSSGGKHTGEEIIKQARSSNKKRDDAEYNLIQFGDDIEQSGEPKTRGKARDIAVENKINNKKSLNENKMKRLKFKKPFDGVGNALRLIPETYRVDNKTFQMTDGNENYEIRWEGSLSEGKAVVLKASDENMINEDMQKMKHLMGFKSQDTLGILKGKERIQESTDNSFRSMLDKTRKLMTESEEEIEEGIDYTMGRDDEDQLPNPPAEINIDVNEESSEHGEYYVVGTNRGDEVDGMEIKDFNVVSGYEKEEIERNNPYAYFKGPYFSEREAYEALDSANQSKLDFLKHAMDDDDYGKGNNRVIDPLDRFEIDSLDSDSDF